MSEALKKTMLEKFSSGIVLSFGRWRYNKNPPIRGFQKGSSKNTGVFFKKSKLFSNQCSMQKVSRFWVKKMNKLGFYPKIAKNLNFQCCIPFLLMQMLRVHIMHNVTRRIGLHRATWGQLDERRVPASVAQWSEHSSRKRKVRGSSPRRVTPCRFFIELSSIYLLSCEHSPVTQIST